MRKAGADMQELKISIHALHEESDCRAGARRTCSGYFNPRSP